MIDAIVDFLDKHELAPAVYRTAVRLARRTEPGASYVRVSYEEMLLIVGSESENTVRGHLATLARTGVLTYKRNHAVQVMWADVICERSQRAVGDQSARWEISEEDAARGGRALRAVGDHDDPEDEKIDLTPRGSRGGRSNRAVGDHPLNTIGRLVGGSSTTPTYLPGGSGGNSPLTDEQRRTVALLTDPEVGMDEVTATRLAQKHASFAFVRAHVFATLEDMRAGKVKVYVLPSRLSRGGMPKITEADRQSALWRRHADAADAVDAVDELRQKYLPDEYAGVIIG